jgi:hypothetical protein
MVPLKPFMASAVTRVSTLQQRLAHEVEDLLLARLGPKNLVECEVSVTKTRIARLRSAVGLR